MGKAKPRHKNNRKHNNAQPTGLPSLKDFETSEEQLQPPDESAFLNIIEEVQSSNVEERLCGLQSLLALSEKPESIELIIKHKVLKVVGPFLVDTHSEVRNFAAGVLRNLSTSGSVDICERLVKDDVMTPLIALLSQYAEWQPESSKSENTDTLLQVVHILWNLCENDDTALKYFGSANLLNILLRCLDYKTVGLDLTITVCQCLSSVSEDNSDVITALRRHEAEFLSLLSITTSTDNKLLLLKTLAAGIVVNIIPSTPWVAPVLSVIHEALSGDIRDLANQLSSRLPLDAPAGPPSLPAEVQVSLDSAEALADAQTRALEILTNLTASQDDEMDVESAESDSEEEEINGWSEAGDTHPLVLSPEIHEAMEKYKMIQLVLTKVEPLPVNVLDILNNCCNSKSLAKKMVGLQCRGFLCFNNLVAVVDVEQLGGPDHLFSLVTQISALNTQQCTTDLNIELLEASTAAIRAILLRLASVRYLIKHITSSDLEVMFKIGLSSDPRVQANVIRIVGTLGVLLMNSDPPLFKMAGNYLLESAEKQQALWLTAEAIDALLDMFSEDVTDQAATEINLVCRLQALAPRLKSKMRQERRTLGDHYPVVSTVITNLTPFIKYKGPRVADLNKL